MMTCADELWLAMTFWVVRFVHWSSNSQCVSHSAALCRNLSCQDTDVFSTTCWGQNAIWQTQLGTNSDLGLSLDTDTCIVHKQTNKDCALRATINSDRSATSSVWHKQEEKQPRRRDASATRGNNLVNVGKYTNLTWLSRDSTSRGVAGVNMVVKGCSSQQKQRKKRNSDFSDMKIVFWRTSETKKSRKKKPLENNEKGQRKKCKDSYFLTWELSFQKTKKKERCNGCPAAEINDNRMHMDLTRSTTSRHAAIVKRVFERARDPQRMWISRDYHEMRYGQKHFCYKGNFCGMNVIQNNRKRVERDFPRR